MDVFIRADASLAMGQGHVMRCLTLASALREHGLISTFVCREHPGNLCDFIEACGFDVNRMPVSDEPVSSGAGAVYTSWLGAAWPEDAAQTRAAIDRTGRSPQWLVVDHYAIDVRWENSLRASVGRIMAIDDLGDRPHDADLLLDQNLYTDMGGRYAGLLPAGCTQLLGPQYALLRQEFIDARANLRLRDGSIRRVLVFFGGSDATNVTGKALDAITMLNMPNLEFDVVVGGANPRKEALTVQCASLPGVRLHSQVSHMAALMASADLSLGAGGSTTWERCATGLPSLVVSVAENQVAIAQGVDRVNAQRYLGPASEVSAHMWAAAIGEMRADPVVLQKMSKAALALVDARGAQRVVTALKDIP